MSKVLWHTMVSADGFIAGPNDDMRAFFDVDGGSGETAREVVRSIGALLVGRRTQDVEDRDQPGFYGGAYRGPFFVLRHDPPARRSSARVCVSRCRLRRPLRRPWRMSAGIGSVGAVRAGAYGACEVVAERGMVFADARYGVPDRASHA